jgi:hypothetical protein
VTGGNVNQNVTENKCQLTRLEKVALPGKVQNHAGLDEFWFG